jgi:hypothetical protein
MNLKTTLKILLLILIAAFVAFCLVAELPTWSKGMPE